MYPANGESAGLIRRLFHTIQVPGGVLPVGGVGVPDILDLSHAPTAGVNLKVPYNLHPCLYLSIVTFICK
ncbi:MAG: hypothetical protein H8D45_30960 [Bacteroidetes bacterium]|nr:hypothetical protein [Bacteroidota bacterium]MBL7136916.1 hypothetical protein [Candidatus Neomarinimicrobiota bacterium]